MPARMMRLSNRGKKKGSWMCSRLTHTTHFRILLTEAPCRRRKARPDQSNADMCCWGKISKLAVERERSFGFCKEIAWTGLLDAYLKASTCVWWPIITRLKTETIVVKSGLAQLYGPLAHSGRSIAVYIRGLFGLTKILENGRVDTVDWLVLGGSRRERTLHGNS